MLGNPFTYRAFDLTTMAPLDQLPYQGNVTFGRSLNAPGPWTGKLPLADPNVQALNWRDASRTGRTMLVVDLLGTVIWGGIIWTRTYQRSALGQPITVGAAEFGSYFQQRLQAKDYTATWAAGADPMSIAQTVIEDALAVGNLAGGLTVTLNPGTSGQSSAPSYSGLSVQTLDSIYQILSQQGYTFGFDYSYDVAYLPGTRIPGVTLNLWYPRQGVTAARSQIVILAGDTLDYTYPEDSTQQANEVTETASGNVAPATASAAIPGYPLLQRAFPRTQVTDDGTLSNIAFGDLALYCHPVVTPTIILPVPGPLGFGQFSLGDDLLFKIDPVAGGGQNTDPRFPQGMAFEWRMPGWTCTVPDQGIATLLLDLAIPPINTIPPPAPPL